MNVVITGGNRGIGFETVKTFLQNGDVVFAISRTVDQLIKLKDQFDTLYIIQTDLSKDVHLEACVDQLKQKTNQIDVLVNNAGYLVNKDFHDITIEDFEYSINVNLKVPFFLTQKLISLLSRCKGQVINIGSMGGYQGSSKFSGLSIYSATKGAVATLTECLAQELKEKNVRFNCLALGAVQTEMLEKAFPDYKADVSPAQMASYIFNFATVGAKLINGKVLPVSFNTP